MGEPSDRDSNVRGSWPYPWREGLVVLVLATYALVVEDDTLDLEPTQALTELPLLLYLMLLLQAPLRDRWWKSLAAALPLAWLYTAHDQFLIMFGNVPSLGDFALLPDLYVSLNWLRTIGTTLLIALPALVWFGALDHTPRIPQRSTLVMTLPSLTVLGALMIAPGPSYGWINAITPDEEWSDRATAERWGRLYSLLMREARRGGFADGITGFTPLAQSSIRLEPALTQQLDQRNVHIVVMESFVDVRLLREVSFSQPPLAPEFTAWADPFIGSSISPVYGGETARAEFEVLCGVPSLRLYGVEFLGFTGNKTYCLPTILGDAGYRTVLSFPHGPVFFNTKRAYPGLGFQQVIFADRFSDPGVESIALGDQYYLYDGDFLPQNLNKVRALVKQGKPFLNYVMTIYGHWPFEIDTDAHPLRVETTPAIADLEAISNQMLQRTEALNTFVQGLVEVDPRSVIVLVGDHLPPMPGGIGDYARLGYQSRMGLSGNVRQLGAYENFLLVLVDGKPVKLPLMRHFDLPHWVLNELSHGAYCQQKRCDFGHLPIDKRSYVDAYQTIIGLAATAM